MSTPNQDHHPFMTAVGGHVLIHDGQSGRVLSNDWIGICVDASDAKKFWLIGREGGERTFDSLQAKNFDDAMLEAGCLIARRSDSSRAYYESVVQIRILSEDSPVSGGMSLEDLVRAIDQGDCVGQTSFLGAQQISAQTVARRLSEMGSAPGFFRLNADGVHEDDEDDDAPSVECQTA